LGTGGLAWPCPALLLKQDVVLNTRLFPRGRSLDDFVNEVIRFRLFSRHKIVSFGVGPNLFNRLAGMFRQDFVQALSNLQDLPGVDVDIGRFPL
jgi:hypothetical protein